jgi:hypothetical protein
MSDGRWHAMTGYPDSSSAAGLSRIRPAHHALTRLPVTETSACEMPALKGASQTRAGPQTSNACRQSQPVT